MPIAELRRRVRPADRLAGPDQVLDVLDALRGLRAEGPAGAQGHRQIALLHHGPLRLVLFAFEAGGRLPAHQARGWVTLHVLRGSIYVHTPTTLHALGAGQLLSLAPGVLHDVDAVTEADLLLGVYPDGFAGEIGQPD